MLDRLMYKFGSPFPAITIYAGRKVSTPGIHLTKTTQDLIGTGIEMLCDVILQFLYESLYLLRSRVCFKDCAEFGEDHHHSFSKIPVLLIGPSFGFFLKLFSISSK